MRGLQDTGLAGAGLSEGALGWGGHQDAVAPSQSPQHHPMGPCPHPLLTWVLWHWGM